MGTLFRDTGTVFWRAMRLSLRNPAWLVIMMMQPILYIVLFGPLLEPLSGQLGAGNAYQIFVPGILVQLGIFGSLFVGLRPDRRVPRRRHREPAGHPGQPHRAPAGACAARRRRPVVQGTLLVLVSIPLGLRAPLSGWCCRCWSSRCWGRRSRPSRTRWRSPQERGRLRAAADAFVLPVLLLSGILLPMTLAPGLAADGQRRQPAQARRRAPASSSWAVRHLHRVVGCSRSRSSWPCSGGRSASDGSGVSRAERSTVPGVRRGVVTPRVNVESHSGGCPAFAVSGPSVRGG